RAWLFAEDGDWDDATTYFNRVLDTEPTYAMAYLGLLCVDLRVSKEKNLEKIKSPANITNHKHYKRAAADPAVNSRLDDYLQTIKDRIDAEVERQRVETERKRAAAEEAARRKQVQDAYDSASKIMDKAESHADYDKAIAALGNIDTAYQDISSQIKAKIAEGEKKKAEVITKFKKKYGVLLERLTDKGKAKAGERRKAAQAQLDEENEKAKAAHEAEYQHSLNEYQANHEKWVTENGSVKAEHDAKLSSWQAEVNRIKAENDTLHRRWQEEVAAAQTQSETWKSQRLCPHCGIGKIGFFGSCKECKRKGDEAITVPLPPGYIDYPPEPVMPYNMPPEPVKPQQKAFTPRQLKDETTPTLPADVTATIKGEHVYVKMAGIDWLVLAMEEEKALLISEKVLEERPYHKEGGDITWEKCSLRKYLNDDFYNRLGAAKGAVAETRNINSNNPWYGTKGGSNTTDKVFLLSLDEVVKYFGDSGDLKNKKRKKYNGELASDGYYLHDKLNSARIAKDKKGEACWWWLRSPGGRSSYAADVGGDGYVGVAGRHVSDAPGVRPALWLNL
ncbi:MAG: DUF6273 domain-containing protein, partial [Lachnospiraceae bacterium]|nr:DUF6273 domain-containing protein [Lachnospiraceae bacterium]